MENLHLTADIFYSAFLGLAKKEQKFFINKLFANNNDLIEITNENKQIDKSFEDLEKFIAKNRVSLPEDYKFNREELHEK